MVRKEPFELSGGRLCLDLVNTVKDRPSSPRELLETYSDLLSWARQAGVLSRREALQLAARARTRPKAAGRALGRARRLREALFDVFSGRNDSGLEALAAELPRAFRRPGLSAGPPYRLEWDDAFSGLDRVLGPVVRSAVALLTSDELERVRVCGAPDCAWLFLDESRNRSRQWCDMKVCGNRSKARRFYRRMRALKRRGSRAALRSGGTRRRPSRG